MRYLIILLSMLTTLTLSGQWFTTANGGNYTAQCTASGQSATAMGGAVFGPLPGPAASGDYSTAMGQSTIASGFASTAMGGTAFPFLLPGPIASGDYSTAMGQATTASGYAATAMGRETNASGWFSCTSGFQTSALGFSTFAIGIWNDDNSPSSSTYNSSNNAFIIGNGLSPEFRSNAMTVLFDGTTTIAGDFTVNSDVRLKTNISSLGNTLPLLKMLDGKKYTLKANASKEKLGLLAQDVREVFPQLIREAGDDLGTLSLNYQGLIPVLINAVNEQQDIIEKQQEQIDKLTEMVEKLVSKG